MSSGNPIQIAMPTVAETIRDKVRVTIMASIPDEQIDALVKKEFDDFFATPQTDRWSGSPPKLSKFQDMVQKEIDQIIKDKVKASVRDAMDKFNTLQWDQSGQRFIQEYVKTYAPAALEGIASRLVADSLVHLNQNRPY